MCMQFVMVSLSMLNCTMLNKGGIETEQGFELALIAPLLAETAKTIKRKRNTRRWVSYCLRHETISKHSSHKHSQENPTITTNGPQAFPSPAVSFFEHDCTLLRFYWNGGLCYDVFNTVLSPLTNVTLHLSKLTSVYRVQDCLLLC